LAQEGCKGFEFFLDKETWPHIISSHNCFVFKKVNPKTRLSDSQYMSFLFFSFTFDFAYYPFFCLDCPCRFSI